MTLSSELQLDVLENVRSMENIVRRYRDQAETEGRLSDQVVQALLQAGVGRLYLPKSLGGLEVDPCTCAAVTQALARVDSSAAWFVMVANAAKLNAGHWPMKLSRT